MHGNGGVLTNPSGDGERLVWTPRVEGTPFNMTAVRAKSGTVKGFKTFSDNPYWNKGLKFISWHADLNGKKEMKAEGFNKYKSVNSYGVEKLKDIEVKVLVEIPAPAPVAK
jgi:hypothetical protein